MRKDEEESEEFVTKKGLRQGGALNPILLVTIMDDVAKEIKSKIKQTHIRYKCVETMSYAECVFADDLVVFTKNKTELKYNLMLWEEALTKKN